MFEIADGQGARLEAAKLAGHALLCPQCGAIAAVLLPPEDYLPTIPSPPGFPYAAATQEELYTRAATNGNGHVRGRRKSRAELATEIKHYLFLNPEASKDEVRQAVGGRSATVHSIIKDLETDPSWRKNWGVIEERESEPEVNREALWSIEELIAQYGCD
jgi:hypothetical protein